MLSKCLMCPMLRWYQYQGLLDGVMDLVFSSLSPQFVITLPILGMSFRCLWTWEHSLCCSNLNIPWSKNLPVFMDRVTNSKLANLIPKEDIVNACLTSRCNLGNNPSVCFILLFYQLSGIGLGSFVYLLYVTQILHFTSNVHVGSRTLQNGDMNSSILPFGTKPWTFFLSHNRFG